MHAQSSHSALDDDDQAVPSAQGLSHDLLPRVIRLIHWTLVSTNRSFVRKIGGTRQLRHWPNAEHRAFPHFLQSLSVRQNEGGGGVPGYILTSGAMEHQTSCMPWGGRHASRGEGEGAKCMIRTKK